MVQTVYPSSYQDAISIFDFNMRPGPSTFARPDCTNSANPSACPRGTNPGRTYVTASLLPASFAVGNPDKSPLFRS